MKNTTPLSVAIDRAGEARQRLDEFHVAAMDPHADQHHVKLGIGHWREVLANAEAVLRGHGYDPNEA